MAVTLFEQQNCWPTGTQDGEDWATDGEGVHTVGPHDLVTQLNNLASYCQPWAQYARSSAFSAANTFTATNTVTSGTGEYLIFQMPIVVPAGAARMSWTAGVVRTGGTGSVTAAAVYLSKVQYTRTAYNTAINQNGFLPRTLPGTFGLGAVKSATALDPVLSSAGYRLVGDVRAEDGVTGLTRARVERRSGTGLTYTSNLIFTLTCEGAATLEMGVADFTCWFLFE